MEKGNVRLEEGSIGGLNVDRSMEKSTSSRLRVFALTAFCFSSAVGVLTAAFPLPTEGPPPFRRDRLALEKEMQRELSIYMIKVGKSIPAQTAGQRRGKVQALALALALDPGNESAREILALLESGKPVDPEEVSQREIFSAEKKIAWLRQKPDEDSQALAACLSDVMNVYMPERGDDENPTGTGKWRNWVLDVSEYEDVPIAPPAMPAPSVQSEAKPAFRLTSGSVEVLALLPGGKGQSTATLEMSIQLGEEFAIKGWKPFKAVQSLLLKRHPDAPAGMVDLSIKGTPPGVAESSAAVFVLGEAAITGQEPTGLILGQISEDGKYQLPPNLWSSLMNLYPDQGGKLILPASAAEYLPSLLVAEKADFFLKYEILLAVSPDELMARAAKIPDDKVAAAQRRYSALIDQSRGIPLASFLSTAGVRSQLEEIAVAMPYHASARMLAMQAAGRRPNFFSRMVAASVLQEKLSAMLALGNQTSAPTVGFLPQMERDYEATRSGVAEIEKYVESSDKILLQESNELVNKFRILIRAYKSKDVYYSGNLGIDQAFIEFAKASKDLKKHLITAKSGK